MKYLAFVLPCFVTTLASPLYAKTEVKLEASPQQAKNNGLPPLPAPRPQYATEWDEAKALGIAPPIAKEAVDALSPEERIKQANAIKQLYLFQRLIEQGDKHTVLTRAQWQECAQLGTQLGAPACIMENLQYRATHDEPYPARVRYFLRRSQSQTMHHYRVDDILINLFVERNEIPLKELNLLLAADHLPWSQVFNYPQAKLTADGKKPETSDTELQSRYERLNAALQQMIAIYSSIKDKPTAQQAAEQLTPLLSAYNEITLIFQSGDPALADYFLRHIKKADDFVTDLKKLHELRQQNRVLKFFGDHHMQLIDQLLR